VAFRGSSRGGHLGVGEKEEWVILIACSGVLMVLDLYNIASVDEMKGIL
jgi:hypothetical protein